MFRLRRKLLHGLSTVGGGGNAPCLEKLYLLLKPLNPRDERLRRLRKGGSADLYERQLELKALRGAFGHLHEGVLENGNIVEYLRLGKDFCLFLKAEHLPRERLDDGGSVLHTGDEHEVSKVVYEFIADSGNIRRAGVELVNAGENSGHIPFGNPVRKLEKVFPPGKTGAAAHGVRGHSPVGAAADVKKRKGVPHSAVRQLSDKEGGFVLYLNLLPAADVFDALRDYLRRHTPEIKAHAS